MAESRVPFPGSPADDSGDGRDRRRSRADAAPPLGVQLKVDIEEDDGELGVDPGQTLATFVDGLGERWARGIDKTSTYHPYAAGLRLRVLPTLGHLPLAMITAGLVDRAIDGWEEATAAPR